MSMFRQLLINEKQKVKYDYSKIIVSGCEDDMINGIYSSYGNNKTYTKYSENPYIYYFVIFELNEMWIIRACIKSGQAVDLYTSTTSSKYPVGLTYSDTNLTISFAQKE